MKWNNYYTNKESVNPEYRVDKVKISKFSKTIE